MRGGKSGQQGRLGDKLGVDDPALFGQFRQDAGLRQASQHLATSGVDCAKDPVLADKDVPRRVSEGTGDATLTERDVARVIHVRSAAFRRLVRSRRVGPARWAPCRAPCTHGRGRERRPTIQRVELAHGGPALRKLACPTLRLFVVPPGHHVLVVGGLFVVPPLGGLFVGGLSVEPRLEPEPRTRRLPDSRSKASRALTDFSFASKAARYFAMASSVRSKASSDWA